MKNTMNTKGNTEKKEKPKATQLPVNLDLREYFAAKAMQGIMAGILGDGGDWPNREIVVANAYAIADAMLAERAK